MDRPWGCWPAPPTYAGRGRTPPGWSWPACCSGRAGSTRPRGTSRCCWNRTRAIRRPTWAWPAWRWTGTTWKGLWTRFRTAWTARSRGRPALLLTAEVRQRRDDRDAAQTACGRRRRRRQDAPWPDPFLEEVREAKGGRACASNSPNNGGWRTGPKKGGGGDPGNPSGRSGVRRMQGRRRPVEARRPGGRRTILAARRGAVPNSADANFVLGVALLGRKDADGAAACFRRVLQLQPYHAAAYDHLGQGRSLQGDRGAIRALQAAVRYQPQQAELQRRLGERLAADGKDVEALEHLRRALYLDPDNRQAQALIEQVGRHRSPPR